MERAIGCRCNSLKRIIHRVHQKASDFASVGLFSTIGPRLKKEVKNGYPSMVNKDNAFSINFVYVLLTD